MTAPSEALRCSPWPDEWRTLVAVGQEAAAALRVRTQLPPRLAVLSAPFPVAEARGALRGFGVMLEDFAARGNRMPPRPAWLKKDPRPALSGLLGCTALMVNDANLAALGEAWFGSGRGRRAVFHICVADGIGAGFVFDGRLFTGAHGFSGELATSRSRPRVPRASAGTAAAYHQTARRSGPADPRSAGAWPEPASLRGPLARPLITMLDPDCVPVDARLADGCGPFITGVTTELKQRCPPVLARTVTIVAASSLTPNGTAPSPPPTRSGGAGLPERVAGAAPGDQGSECGSHLTCSALNPPN